MTKGWKRESARHSLAAKKIKTGRKDEQNLKKQLIEEEKRARWYIKTPSRIKPAIQLARAIPSDVDRLAKLSNKELLNEYHDAYSLQFIIGQTSVMDAQLFDLMEREISIRGLDDKADAIVEKLERSAEEND